MQIETIFLYFLTKFLFALDADYANSYYPWKGFSDETLLTDALIRNFTHCRTSRPSKDYDTKTHVQVSLVLRSIISLDKKGLSLTISTFLHWEDQRASYTRDTFPQAADRTGLLGKFIWTPELNLLNGRSTPSARQFTFLYMTGQVQNADAQHYFIPCTLDLTNFPHDRQTCHMELGSIKHKLHEVFFDDYLSRRFRHIIRADASIDSKMWTFLFTETTAKKQTTIRADLQYEIFHVTIQLERKSEFFKLSILYPTIILAVFSFTVFLIPQMLRVHFIFKLCICYALMILTYVKMLPAVAPTKIGNYLFGNLLMLGVTMVISVIRILLVGKHSYMPGWIRKLVRVILFDCAALAKVNQEQAGVRNRLNQGWKDWQALSTVLKRINIIVYVSFNLYAIVFYYPR